MLLELKTTQTTLSAVITYTGPSSIMPFCLNVSGSENDSHTVILSTWQTYEIIIVIVIFPLRLIL